MTERLDDDISRDPIYPSPVVFPEVLDGVREELRAVLRNHADWTDEQIVDQVRHGLPDLDWSWWGTLVEPLHPRNYAVMDTVVRSRLITIEQKIAFSHAYDLEDRRTLWKIVKHERTTLLSLLDEVRRFTLGL